MCYLGDASSPVSVSPLLQVEAADLTGVPGEYCSPPQGCLFSLLGPEREAMDKYIQESIKAGLIRHSSSPAGAGFFFVKKKDGSLRPCIDY